jgi:hypothetical protein
MSERDFPHIVKLPLPEGGFGRMLEAIDAFHRDCGIEARGLAGSAEPA